MRVSADRSDPGYEYWRNRMELGYCLGAYLDGERISHVVTADTDEEIIIRHKVDESGQAVVNADCTEIERETLRGSVEIVERERAR